MRVQISPRVPHKISSIKFRDANNYKCKENLVCRNHGEIYMIKLKTLLFEKGYGVDKIAPRWMNKSEEIIFNIPSNK
jgi:hypothetical protein